MCARGIDQLDVFCCVFCDELRLQPRILIHGDLCGPVLFSGAGSARLGSARRSSVSLGWAESITLNVSPLAVCAAVRLADGSTLQLFAARRLRRCDGGAFSGIGFLIGSRLLPKRASAIVFSCCVCDVKKQVPSATDNGEFFR